MKTAKMRTSSRAGFGDGVVLRADLERFAVAARARRTAASASPARPPAARRPRSARSRPGREVGQRLVAVAGDRHVDQHQLHARSEDRRLRFGRRRRRRARLSEPAAGGWPAPDARRPARCLRSRWPRRGRQQQRPMQGARGRGHHASPLRALHDRHLQRALAIEVERADVQGQRRLHPLVDRLA